MHNYKSLIWGTKLPYMNVLNCNFKKLLSYLKTTLSNAKKVHRKTNRFGIWDQNYLISVFRQDFEETHYHIWISTLQFVKVKKDSMHNPKSIWNLHSWSFQISSFCEKVKIVKLPDENVLFRFFGQHLRKTIVMFEVSALDFVSFQSLVQN